MKKFKKLASLVMAAMMALTVSVTANAEGEEVLVKESFEGTVSSTVWTDNYEITDGVNKSITSSSAGTRLYCNLGKTVTSGAMIISYDVMLPAKAGVRIKQVWDDNNKRPYLLQATSTGYITINDKPLCAYEPGQWYNITEVVDVKNKKIYAYIDGNYIEEYAWRDDNGVASGVNKIETQYNTNEIYVDNAYIASYTNKTSADAALSAMLTKKISLDKSSFDVAKNTKVTNDVKPITSGAEIISYDISGNPVGGRLMQVYDNTLTTDARTALIAISKAGKVKVNDADTGYAWDSTKTNNIALVFDAEKTKFSVYYNGVRIAKDKDSFRDGKDIARVEFQNGNEDDTTKATVSNAWARSFASYADAVKYIEAVKNADAMAHYGANSAVINTAINDYSRALDSIIATDVEKSAIIDKISAMMPYKNIFAENFDNVSALIGYTVADNATIVDNKLRLTYSAPKARLLKTVSGSTNIITECNFMQEVKSNIDSIVRVTDQKGEYESVKIYAELGDIKMLYGTGTEGTFAYKTLVDNYNTNQWYNIKAYSNFDNKTVSVYIDDVFMGTYAFMSTAMEDLNRVFDSYTNSAGTYYIDNIKVYNDDILEASAAIEVASKATENITLPLTAGEYGVSWATNNSDYIAADGTVISPVGISQPVILTANVSNGVVGVDIKFTTRAAGSDKFEIGKVIYADANEFSTETLTGAKGIKRVYINKNDDSINGTLIVAMYGINDRFINAKIVDANEAENSISLPIEEGTTKIKIFVWDKNLEKCTPYAKPLEIN